MEKIKKEETYNIIGMLEEVSQLMASNMDKYNYFGSAVALSADGLVAIVGAYGENTKAYDAGKVYTYKRSSIDADWEEVNQLVASDGKASDYFGSSVALSGDGLIAMVGAHGSDTQIDNAGKVYTYKRTNIDADWEEVSQLTASGAGEDDYFGKSVALSGDGLISMVGAYGSDTQVDNTGKVYTYKRSSIDADWEEVNQLVASDGEASDGFGVSIALSENGLMSIVGAFRRNIQAYDVGKVYTYKRTNIDADWEEVNQLVASDGRKYDNFGKSVALSGDGLIAMVGAYGSDTQVDNAGKVYTYKRDNIDAYWEEVSQLTASDGEEGDAFGSSIALSVDSSVVMVGAEDKSNELINTGKVYTYIAR